MELSTEHKKNKKEEVETRKKVINEKQQPHLHAICLLLV